MINELKLESVNSDLKINMEKTIIMFNKVALPDGVTVMRYDW